MQVKFLLEVCFEKIRGRTLVEDSLAQRDLLECDEQEESPEAHPFKVLVFLYGWRGLVIAVGDANGAFFEYKKSFADSND